MAIEWLVFVGSRELYVDKSNWISLRLTGTKSNRAAIGAKIKLPVTDATGKQFLRYREVSSGGPFGASSLTQHIGLGQELKTGSNERASRHGSPFRFE